MDTLLINFGMHLAKLRQDRGLSQEALAELSGLHRTYISSLERGKRNPTLTTLNSLKMALDIKFTDLLKFEDR
ncbi:TPA: helix-turn-helix domain-containing protein [Neisseria lactamica]